jgi:hypothetical protein
MIDPSLPVDVRILKYTAACVGLSIVLAYVLLAHRLKLLSVAALTALAAIYFGEQYVFITLVEPAVAEATPGSVTAVLAAAQNTFEIGFVAKLVLMLVELVLEDLFGSNEGTLRGLRDAGFDALSTVIIVVAAVVVVVVGFGAQQVVPVLSLLFSLKLVETFVDLAVALTYE